MSRFRNIKNKDNYIAQEYIFVPCKDENRCNKCIFAYSKLCEEAECTSEERKDGKTGFFRARYDLKHEHKFSQNTNQKN